MHEDAVIEVRNCVFWAAADQGRIALLPWDARYDRYFVISPQGLEQRLGRPSEIVGHGMSRAKTRLDLLARTLRQDEFGTSVAVATVPVTV